MTEVIPIAVAPPKAQAPVAATPRSIAVSVFDLFKIGVGPSSSHTVGPMRAAAGFVKELLASEQGAKVGRLRCTLYGSLALTGKGHGSDKAVLLGLQGEEPDQVDPDVIDQTLVDIRSSKRLRLPNGHDIVFDERADLVFNRRETLPLHPNGMRFEAFDTEGQLLSSTVNYSVGGGFVVQADEQGGLRTPEDTRECKYPFDTAQDLLDQCHAHRMSMAELMWANELAWSDAESVQSRLKKIWEAMQACVARGLKTEGALPGGFKVKRRAPALYANLLRHPEAAHRDPLQVIDWVNLYALAVNEENAAGGRVVTAPTNGAAGIIPAVLHYYQRFVHGASERGVMDFLMTAAAIATLYKKNASISGAEVGCQGEVGVACSMAAAALCAVMGGTPDQVENAAEIGMEHHLGLTCDPVGGLVQIPCIERNAIGAVKAINAARMALQGDGQHYVSLDEVIKTMRETGADMKTKYKETARGGLAVNVVDC